MTIYQISKVLSKQSYNDCKLARVSTSSIFGFGSMFSEPFFLLENISW